MPLFGKIFIDIMSIENNKSKRQNQGDDIGMYLFISNNMCISRRIYFKK